MTGLTKLLVSFPIAGLLFAGCAGQLTDAEKELLSRDLDGSLAGGVGGGGGAGGAGGSTETGGVGGVGGATGGTGGATGGTGGAAGAGGSGMLDPCMAPLMKDKCSLSGCHGGAQVVAGLDLSATIVAAPQMLVDKANKGDSTGCGASVAKIIDSQKPEQSLLYTKVTTPPCGAKMPPSGALATAETSCILNWIKSIPGVGGGTGGAAGAGGTGGASGTGGAGGAGGTTDAGRDASRG